jgi:sugar lactone lactonase YvrE
MKPLAEKQAQGAEGRRPPGTTGVAVLALAVLFSLAACATKAWETEIGRSAELTWPLEPGPVNVRYLGEMKGFLQSGFSVVDLFVGKSGRGRLGKPVAVAVGEDGRMAIADLEPRGVHFYRPESKSYHFLLPTPLGELQSPVGLAFGDRSILYVVDSVMKKVLLFDENGQFRQAIATAGGKPFGRPTGVVFQKQQQLLFVADTGLHQLHVFSPAGQFLKSYGSRGAAEEGLNFPTHLGLDAEGKIYVNDTLNFRIKKIDPDGHVEESFGHHGDGSGDFAMPKGVGVDRWGTIYVVDALFDRVQLFSQKGEFLLSVGDRGTGPGEFWLPSGLSIDQTDRLFVCDTYNHRVQVFQLVGGP